MINQEELIKEHADFLLNFAFSKVRDEELAKDLVQETFLAALKNLSDFEKRSSLRTWLVSILNRKIIDHWRKAETRYTSNLSELQREKDVDLSAFLGVDDKNIESVLEQGELTKRLNECIDKLPDNYKAVISMRYLDEKKGDEVCKELNISPSNLWVIAHRAKLLLKDCLTQGEL